MERYARPLLSEGAPGRPDGSPPPWAQAPLNAPARVGVGVFFAATLLLFVMLFLYVQESAFSAATRAVFALCEVFLIIIMFCSIVYVAIMQYYVTGQRKSPVLDDYDHLEYSRYLNYLEAVSIGAGVEPPALAVTGLCSPLAYYDAVAGICVTGELLEAGLEAAHVESIMAVLLVRTIIDKGEAATREAFAHRAREIGLNDHLVELVRAEFADDRACLFHILADTYAARLTGQPGAIKSAILEADRMLAGTPKRPSRVEPRFIFVEPPIASGSGHLKMPSWLLPAALRGFNATRDRVIRLRVENLEFLEFGSRHPHEEVRDSMPVTTPEGWE